MWGVPQALRSRKRGERSRKTKKISETLR